MGYFTRWLGRRITKSVDASANTPEGKAAIECGHRKMALAERARQIAGTGLDDEAAREELGALLPEDGETVGGAIEHLAGMRTGYRDDRAYRLLSAAATGAPVRPIDPAVLELFSAEARLGRMSLNDAFDYLVSLEPRLPTLLARKVPKQGWSRSSEPILVGPGAEATHALVGTDLARHVVSEHAIARKDGPPDSSSTSAAALAMAKGLHGKAAASPVPS
jgi:hypothetical protein